MGRADFCELIVDELGHDLENVSDTKFLLVVSKHMFVRVNSIDNTQSELVQKLQDITMMLAELARRFVLLSDRVDALEKNIIEVS